MASLSNEEKLNAAITTLATIDSTLLTLYAKTASSTSFGDQSLTLASIKELEESRMRYKHEIERLEDAVNQHRKTLKIYFR